MFGFLKSGWGSIKKELDSSPLQTIGSVLATIWLIKGGGGATIQIFTGGASASAHTPVWHFVAFAIGMASVLGAMTAAVTHKRLFGGVCVYFGLLALAYALLKEIVNDPNNEILGYGANAMGWAFGLTYFAFFFEAFWEVAKRDDSGKPSTQPTSAEDMQTAMLMAGVFALPTWIVLCFAVWIAGQGPLGSS